jgi:hypothetical protein
LVCLANPPMVIVALIIASVARQIEVVARELRAQLEVAYGRFLEEP